MPKIPPLSAPALSDELIERIGNAVRSSFYSHMHEWMEVVRRDVVDELLFTPLAAELQAARVRRGLDLKQAAKLAKLPQYVVVGIESGHLMHLTPQAVARYAAAVGAEAHWTRWRDAHTELASRLGRAEASAILALAQQLGADPNSPLAGPGASNGSQPRGRERSARDTQALQLKIVLQDVSPPIWRRILVTSDMSLHRLHDVIQMAMGWGDTHLYQFEFDGMRFGDPGRNDEMEPGERSSHQTLLSDLDLRERTSFRYVYDFGDGWEHLINVERIAEVTPGAAYPSCVAGARACPPEDCGGPFGYTEILEVLADPSHPEHEERLEWVGKGFSPSRFDVKQINADMRQVRWDRRK